MISVVEKDRRKRCSRILGYCLPCVFLGLIAGEMEMDESDGDGR